MRRISQSFSILAVSIFTLGLFAVLPADMVSAERGSGGGGSGSDSSDSSGRRIRETSTTSSRDDASTSVARTSDDGTADQGRGDAAVTTKPEEIRQRAHDLVSEKRGSAKEKSAEDRQKSCEKRKEGIVKRGGNYSRNATKHLGVFNKTYDKVLAFKEKKNLNTANLDALKATADEKRSAAAVAVSAIADVTTDVDCTSADPALAVAAVKESVRNARTALHEYRLAIKDLVLALKNSVDTASPAGRTNEAGDTNDRGADSPSDTTNGGIN